MSGSVEEAITCVSEPREVWCPRCLKDTLIVFAITAVTSQGAHTIGGAAICHECAWSPYSAQEIPPHRPGGPDGRG